MASKRRKRRRECSGKKKFRDQAEAVKSLISFKKEHGHDSMRTYRCNFCKHWHLGHYQFSL